MLRKTILNTIFVSVLFSVIFAGTSIFGLKQGLLGVYRYQYSASSLGRGGYAMGDIDSLSVNQVNFAQWAFLNRTIFVFNCDYHGLWSEIPGKTIYSSNFVFQGGFITIPIKQRKLIMGIGLTPLLSNKQSVEIRESSEIHTIKIEGNVSEAQLALSYLFNPNLSIAVFTRYIMGKVTDYNIRNYNQTNSANVVFTNRYRVHGLGFGIATLYRLNKRISSGIQVGFPAKISIETTEESRNPLPIDKEREAQLPLFLTAGVLYQLNERWNIGMDLDFQNWKSGYRIEDNTVRGMTNSYRLGAGAEYLPVKKRFISYLQRVTYRTGIFVGKFNTIVNEKEIYEYGCNFGLGLPIGLSPNHFDISFEIGNRGNLEKNLARETFFKLHFTFTASELWFLQLER